MTTFSRNRDFLSVGVSLAVLALAAPVRSQTAPPSTASTSAVAEVVVTAQKRTEKVQDVPISINVLSRDVIQQRGVQGVADLQNQVPGVKFGEFAGAGNISIRGVGTAFVSGAGQSSVALYIDGVYLSQPKSFGMVQSDLADIEILRGPQGTLYGRNSTGGVISFTTAAPTSVLSAGASAQVGNYADRKGSAYVSGPLGDRVRARLYIEGEQHDGYVLNDATGQRLDDLSTFGARLSVDADVASWWKSALRVSSRHDTYHGPVLDGFDPRFAIVPAPYNDFDPYRVNSPVYYAGAKTDTLVSFRNTFALAHNVDLISITGFNNFTARQLYDTIGNTAIPFPLQSHTSVQTYTQEFNLRGSTERLKWLGGFYYFLDRQFNNSVSDETSVTGLGYHTYIGDPAVSVLQLTRQKSKEESESGFADATYEVVSGTRLYAGARFTHDELTQRLSSLTSFFGTITPGGCTGDVPQKESSDAVTGRVGVQHDFTGDAMGYAQYSRGYKSPGFSQSTCDNPYLAETVDAGEVGLKSRWLDRRLTINAAAFYYAYDNFQLEQATLTGIPVVNAPKSHVLGLELSTQFTPVRWVRLDANIELLDAKYDDFISQDPNMGVPLGTSLKGIQLDNAPAASANIGAEFDRSLGALGMITLRGEASLTTSYHLREFNVPWAIQGGYALGNLYATYHPPGGHWQLRGFVQNVSNVTRLAGVLGFGGALGVFQAPRTYGLEARVSF